MAVVGESSRFGLPDDLCWLPVVPTATVEVGVVARRLNRSPVADRMLEEAVGIAAELGWL